MVGVSCLASIVWNFFGDQTRWSSMQGLFCASHAKYTTTSNVTIKSNEVAINGKPLSFCLLTVWNALIISLELYEKVL